MDNPLENIISDKYELLKPFLDEQNKRLFAAAEAISLGEGGISIVSRATGIYRDTFQKVAKNWKAELLEQMKHLSLMAKFGLLEEAAKRVLIKISHLHPILKLLLNQQVGVIRNHLCVGPLKVFAS